MCGICGIIGSEQSEVAESRVRAMLAAMVHRGPDDEGLLAAPRSVLGMRRLSIIDLQGGRQPAYNEDRSVAVVFNGEIYNFPELRASLKNRGHSFASRSDTEVIVHAYEEWGDRCVERLRGMFAFALWDGRGQSSGSLEPENRRNPGRVLLARDRLGIKPLYYAHARGTLLFASEVRALLASGAIERRLAPEALHAYLLFGSVVEPMTLVGGVFSLAPGHVLVVPCDTPLETEARAYWNIASAASLAAEASKAPKNVSSASRMARPLLDEAVRSHLIADVPLGIFLSSGLDSTALAALASRERTGLHTFTVAFEEREFSEAALACRTAERLATEHRELLLTEDEMQRRLGEAVGALDQPSMDGINTFFVSWAARQVGLKVALSGLGGDEVFGGYPTFRSTPRLAHLAAMSRCMPASARKLLANVLLGVSRGGNRPHRSDALRKIAAVCADPTALPHPYFFGRMLFTPRQVGMLLSRAGHAALGGTTGTDAHRGAPWSRWLKDTVEQAARFEGDAAVSCLELRTYMLDTLLRDTDTMSMHHSLEVRVPLLDHPLVESIVALPDRAKRRSGVGKALLAEALGPDLPSSVLDQPKRTFTLPWERWLRGPLGLQVAVHLGGLTPSLAAVLDPAVVQSVWRSFLLGRTGWARPWSLFVLDSWVRRHLDEPERPGESNSSPAASVSSAALS